MKKTWACNHKKPFRRISEFLFRCVECPLTITIEDKKEKK